jgi:hypothetical protein
MFEASRFAFRKTITSSIEVSLVVIGVMSRNSQKKDHTRTQHGPFYLSGCLRGFLEHGLVEVRLDLRSKMWHNKWGLEGIWASRMVWNLHMVCLGNSEVLIFQFFSTLPAQSKTSSLADRPWRNLPGLVRWRLPRLTLLPNVGNPKVWVAFELSLDRPHHGLHGGRVIFLPRYIAAWALNFHHKLHGFPPELPRR